MEIWGWTEYSEIEKIQNKFIKWTLGLDRQAPSYLLLQETNRGKLKVETGKRAIKYQKRIRSSWNSLRIESLNEIEKKPRDSGGQRYLQRNGYNLTDIERREEIREDMLASLINGDRSV